MNTTTLPNMNIDNYQSYKASVMLWKILSPILIVFGTIGNVIVIIVLTRKRVRNSPTSIFMSSLAVSDLLALYTGLLRQWIKYTFDLDIRMDLTLSGCRFHWFMVYLATQFSSWMLICVTLERVTSSWLPHKRQNMCSRNSSLVTVSVILVCLIALNSHYLFGYGERSYVDDGVTITRRCVPVTVEYDNFIVYSWTWIDLCVFYLLPMLVLIVGNTMIAYKVVLSHKRTRRAVAPVNENYLPSNSITAHTRSQNNISNLPSNSTTNTRSQNNISNFLPPQITAHTRRQNNISSLTITLMLISVVFVVCISPIVIYPIGEPYWNRGASNSHLADLFLVETFANLLMYINHAINFVLYFLSGSKFRNEVKAMFCKCLGGNGAELPSRTRSMVSDAKPS